MMCVAFNSREISQELSLRSDLDVSQRAGQSLVNFDVSQVRDDGALPCSGEVEAPSLWYWQ